MQSAECRVQSAECRVQSAECGVRSEECRMRSAEWSELLILFFTLHSSLCTLHLDAGRLLTTQCRPLYRLSPPPFDAVVPLADTSP